MQNNVILEESQVSKKSRVGGLNLKSMTSGNTIIEEGLGGTKKHKRHYSTNRQLSDMREKVNHIAKNASEDFTKYLGMALPEIKPRRLEDLDNGDNPFKVIRQNEQLLVFHEKHRELHRLKSVKKRIEHKYLHGDDLYKQLSLGNGQKDRAGMIREVDSIEPERLHAFGQKSRSIAIEDSKNRFSTLQTE